MSWETILAHVTIQIGEHVCPMAIIRKEDRSYAVLDRHTYYSFPGKEGRR